jgi:hypothetical protein
LYSSIKQVKLKRPLDLTQVISSRNLLTLRSDYAQTSLEINRLGQSLYPNPLIQKKGSAKELKWEKAAKSILSPRDAVSESMKDLVRPILIFPISNISFVDGVSILEIYRSKKRLFVEGVQLEHDGGVVNYLVDLENTEIKRQVRVLTSQRQRDLLVSPRSPHQRHSYMNLESSDYSSMTEEQRFKNKVEILTSIAQCQDIHTVESAPRAEVDVGLACLSMLGVCDSSSSVFNKIVGMFA